MKLGLGNPYVLLLLMRSYFFFPFVGEIGGVKPQHPYLPTSYDISNCIMYEFEMSIRGKGS